MSLPPASPPTSPRSLRFLPSADLPSRAPISPPTSPRPNRFPTGTELPRTPVTSPTSSRFSRGDALPYLYPDPVTLIGVKRIIPSDLPIPKPWEVESTFIERAQTVGAVTLPEFEQFAMGRPVPGLNGERVVTAGEMFLRMLFVQIANDFYKVLGQGILMVPTSYLSRQFNLDSVTGMSGPSSSMTPSVVGGGSPDPYGIQSLRVIYKRVEGFQGFESAQTNENGSVLSFADFIRTYHRPPTTIIGPGGASFPLKGVLGYLALGRLIADIAPIGRGLKNAGFVWQRDGAGNIIAAQTAQAVTIRPDLVFQFNVEKNWAYGIHCNEETALGRLIHIKDLQIEADSSLTILWESLTETQKKEFLQVLINSRRYVESPDILNYLFEREGTLYPPEMADSLKQLVVQMKGRVASWLQVQFEIYMEELGQLEMQHSAIIATTREIDQIGELPPDQLEKVKAMARRLASCHQELIGTLRLQSELKKTLEEETGKKEAARAALDSLQATFLALEKRGSEPLRSEIRAITESQGLKLKRTPSAGTGMFRRSRKFPQSGPLKDPPMSSSSSPIMTASCSNSSLSIVPHISVNPDIKFGLIDSWNPIFKEDGSEPPLPDNIETILKTPFPYSGKLFQDLCALVLVKEKVGGQPATLKRLINLVKSPNEGYSPTLCSKIDKSLGKFAEKKQVETSYWMLIPRQVDPKLIGKEYEEQYQFFQERFGGTFEGMGIDNGPARAFELVTYLSLEHARTGQKKFLGNLPWHFGLCVEHKKGDHVVVGGHTYDGFMISTRNNLEKELSRGFSCVLHWAWRLPTG